MKAASNESFGYNEDEIVSSDIVGMRFGSLFDATQTLSLIHIYLILIAEVIDSDEFLLCIFAYDCKDRRIPGIDCTKISCCVKNAV